MIKRSTGKGKIDRREFIAGTAALGAGTALAGGVSKTSTQWWMSACGNEATPIGISNAAYQKAWKRAAAMVAKMTLVEKISQTGNTAPAIRRLGLPAYQYYAGEALHGLRRLPPVTLFPVPTALGCTWNPELLSGVYNAVSAEARAYHNKYGVSLTYYSPVSLNITIDPRWGRCQEEFGEDTYHVGVLAVQAVKGMQGNDSNYLKTAACAKALICNNTENGRMRISATVNPRNFWEYYTRVFSTCIFQGDVFTIMGAYNAINGVPSCADRFLLTNLLRGRWGFRGYVASDCDAIAGICDAHHYVPTMHQAAALGIQAGCDQNCGYTFQQHLRRAVDLNLVGEMDIGRAVTRALTVRFLLGEFDDPEAVPYHTIGFAVVDSPGHRVLALESARQSVVLLKNQNDFLPLDKSMLKSVAVIGPAADFQAGSYAGFSAVHSSPLNAIAKALGTSISTGRIYTGEVVGMSQNLWEQGSAGSPTNVQFARIPGGSWLEFPPLDFTGKQIMVVHISSIAKGGSITARLDKIDGPVIAELAVPLGDWHIYRDATTSLRQRGIGRHKIFLQFNGAPGDLFKIKWIELLPATPSLVPKEGFPKIVYEPGCDITKTIGNSAFRKAIDAAGKADVAIVICGINQLVDSEGMDRQDINLPSVQHELIQACYKANPKTVLVLNTNNTVAINWEQENIPAIVAAIFAGQAQGTAIADVLFGNYNPGGKTCCTWYKSVDQLPPFHNYDIMKGRTYMYFEGQPLYPFGYGLSYTTFQIHDLHINSRELSEKKPVKIACTVKNTGTRAGAEVVQFYVTVPKSPVKRPIKELVGFQRVELQPGESRRVTFTLPYTAQALWYWHESQRKFVLQPGTLKLMIGHSSADIDLTGEVHLRACTNASLGGPETLTTVAVNSEIVAKKV